MKLIARIFRFLYDYIFHIQKFCAIIILVEHTFDPFKWVGVLLLYWISWVCSTFFMQKNGIGFYPDPNIYDSTLTKSRTQQRQNADKEKIPNAECIQDF